MTGTRPEIGRLAAELRLLRERSGLTYAALGTRTPYSKSAWQRYLTAKALPPWSAVEDLCRLVGEPQPRLRALWELAESVSSGRSAVDDSTPAAAAPEPSITPEPATAAHDPSPEAAASGASGVPTASAAPPASAARTRRHRRGGFVVMSALCAMVVVALAVFQFASGDGSHGASNAVTTTRAEESQVVCTGGPCTVTCHGAQCTGLDPELTFCGAQPRTLQQLQTPGDIDLEVRYNPQCRAAWARIWHTRIGDTVTLTAPGMPTQSVRVSDTAESSGFTYTPMIFVAGSEVPLKACVSSAGEPTRCYTATAS